MKKLVILVLSILSLSAFAQQPAPKLLATCAQQIPYGRPTTSKNGPLICRDAYLLQSDLDAKVPMWVSYTLTPDHSIGCVPRSNAFQADQSLPKGSRSDPKDYAGSGFDIGHMANDADQSWDPTVERESFILTNMAPQFPATNRISWKALEEDVRAWALERNHTLLIYVGPIYNAQDKTIGVDKVTVPHAFYKIIVDTKTNEIIAFIYPNLPKESSDITLYATSVSTIESQTGITFPLPKGVDHAAATNLTGWKADIGQYLKAKKEKCK
jgi:endonuclease G